MADQYYKMSHVMFFYGVQGEVYSSGQKPLLLCLLLQVAEKVETHIPVQQMLCYAGAFVLQQPATAFLLGRKHPWTVCRKAILSYSAILPNHAS